MDYSPLCKLLFGSSDQVLVLPPHNAEAVNGGTMTSDGKMVIYCGGGLQMFSETLSKSSWWSPYIFIITVHPITPVSVDDGTLLCDGIFTLGVIRRLSIILPPLQYTFTPCFLHTFYMPSLSHITYGTTIYGLGLPVVALVLMLVHLFWSCPGGALSFIFTLFQSPHGVLVF